VSREIFDCEPYFTISLRETTPIIADVIIDGPPDTVYANKKYNFAFEIPSDYPFNPPVITCKTPIIHPNIYNGKLCVDVLESRSWSPAFTMNKICIIIYNLLSEPDITYRKKSITNEQIIYKSESMQYFKNWPRRNHFMLYLVGMGIWKNESEGNDRYDKIIPQNAASLKVFTTFPMLQNISSYL